MSTTTIALSAPASLRYLRDAGVHPDALHDVLATVAPATSWTGRAGPEPYYYPRDLDAAVAFVKKD